jgi:hypothetical protein
MSIRSVLASLGDLHRSSSARSYPCLFGGATHSAGKPTLHLPERGHSFGRSLS